MPLCPDAAGGIMAMLNKPVAAGAAWLWAICLVVNVRNTTGYRRILRFPQLISKSKGVRSRRLIPRCLGTPSQFAESPFPSAILRNQKKCQVLRLF
jgi:hypothetical protein